MFLITSGCRLYLYIFKYFIISSIRVICNHKNFKFLTIYNRYSAYIIVNIKLIDLYVRHQCSCTSTYVPIIVFKFNYILVHFLKNISGKYLGHFSYLLGH